MYEVEIDRSVYLDCYSHILDDDDIDIQLIWGGRDSGKSKFVAQHFTEECMRLDYFRCLLIKQTHESIKDAQWQMIQDNAEQWEVDPLFEFKLSPLSIKCVNGNTFSTRGTDKPAKIRSFSNPSHAWIEEGNQISEEAFINILTGLRSDYGKVKLYLTFNPESAVPDFRKFWIYKMFFAKYDGQKNFVGTMDIKLKVNGKDEVVQLKYRSTHTTYKDNPFVTWQRIAFHESLKADNYYWYRVFTLGEWGNQENDSPWAFSFNRIRHVGKTRRNFQQTIYLSWDFNRNPMCCNVIQWYDDHIYVLEVIKMMKAGVDSMCEYILVNYPNALFIVTGDYSGDTASSLMKEHVTHYTQIKKYLRLTDGQIQIRPNPRLEKNSTLVNTILAYYSVTIDEQKAQPLIFDMENVKKAADGTIVKEDRKDPAQQADSLDGFRYFCNKFLDWYKPTDEMILERARGAGAVIETGDEPKVLNFLMDKSTVRREGDDVMHDAILAIESGLHVICTKHDYQTCVRNAILDAAGKWIDTNDGVRAQIALEEVRRLDTYFK